ncbi:MAG TPA: LysR family transcriptional regulator [Burkholderiaceae bacterium]|nr:LysR family transcriptional regulator [Burkholderiaceae bacterium]
MNTLPDFDELHAFAVSARLLSLTRAAEELNMTQSAVSQRIKRLEARLGTPLFQRVGREVQLTTAGHEVKAKAETLLNRRASLFKRDHVVERSITVIINTTPSFARGWLLPRLPTLVKCHPDIRPRVMCSLAFTRFRENSPEIALRYGLGAWPQTQSRLFLREWAYPVCSPQLDAAFLPKDDQWEHCRLLEDLHMSWHDWFAQKGQRSPHVLYDFNDSSITLDAVERGYGIALMRHQVCRDAVAEGRLMRIGEDWIEQRSMHWIVTPETDAFSETALWARERVIQWLMKEAIEDNDRS